MKLFGKFICLAAALVLVVSCSVSAFGLNVLEDAKSRWILGDEYGGAVGWNDDGSFTVYGKSGIATYTGVKFYDEEITVKFKTSIASADGWAAIYLRNNIDASLLTSKDDGGGVRAFPWYGKGQPFSINIKNDRVSLSQCYADELQPSGLGIGTPAGQYNPCDGSEHTIKFKCYELNSNQTIITVYYDGVQAFDYSYTYNEEHEPKKEAGYLSFACYNSGDWLQIISVEAPDGTVEFTKDTVTSSSSQSAGTQTGNNGADNNKPAGKNDIDYSAEYNRTSSPSGTIKRNKSNGSASVIWYVVCAAGGVAAGAAGAVLVMKLTGRKKTAAAEAPENSGKTDLPEE